MQTESSVSFPDELLPHKETIHLALLALLSGECQLGNYGICWYLSRKIAPLDSPLFDKKLEQFVYGWVGSTLRDSTINYTIVILPLGEMTKDRIKLANILLSQLS